jgi:hypothetical protein
MTQKQLEDYLWGVYQPLINWRKSRNEIRSLSLIRGLSFLSVLSRG